MLAAKLDDFDGKPLVISTNSADVSGQFCGASAGCRRRNFDANPLVKLTNGGKAGCGPREHHFVENPLPTQRNLPIHEPESRHTISLKKH